MKKNSSLLLFISLYLLFTGNLLSQSPYYSDYNWKENVELSDISISDTNINAYQLINYIGIEYFMDDNGFYEYQLIHKKYKLLRDAGIENFNKRYLPIGDNFELINQKARVINSNGSIIELSENDIKEGVDPETNNKYRYFAFEGIDINSEIEYFYIIKKSPSIKGRKFNIQNQMPQKNVTFEVISPNHLNFSFKTYNGLSEITLDTTLDDKTRWYLSLDSLESFKSEDNALYDANLMYLVFKLQGNYATRKSDLYSYGELSQNIHDAVYSVDKFDEKFYKKIIKQLELEGLSELEKIRYVENFVKQHLYIGDYSLAYGLTLNDIWDSKIADEKTTLIILLNLYKRLDIKTQIVITSDRYENYFDKDYENWIFADVFLIYFPDFKLYTSLNSFPRVGYPEYAYTGQYGLFIKPVKIGETTYGSGKIRYISNLDYEKSYDSLFINASMISDLDTLKATVKHKLFGYKTALYQSYLELIKDEDNALEVKESLVNFMDDEAVIKNFELKNCSSEFYGNKPVIASATIKSVNVFEKAKDDYLFKIGHLIGEQSELYQEKESRVLPVELYYAKNYFRKIIFEIPEGYYVENTDKLNINEEFYINGKDDPIMLFDSKAQLTENNTIEIIIKEYYNEVTLPSENYDDYRRIVNAAADFYNLTIILKQKS